MSTNGMPTMGTVAITSKVVTTVSHLPRLHTEAVCRIYRRLKQF
jgi:hypothetical protein